jgi:scavenger receptor class B, member 1
MFNVEQISGTPLQGQKRLQFSIEIESIEEMEAMKNLKSMLLPFVWVEEGVSLNRTYTNLLKYQLFL